MINKKPHIVIDARLYGPKHTGIGRYTKNLLIALSKLPDFKKYSFTLIIYPELKSEVKKDLGNSFKYVTTNIRHYSLKEQLFLPFLIHYLHPDLVHFTHFNKPIFYFGKSIVTIHDLIKHFFKGRLTTTKNISLYWLKHYFYLISTYITIKNNTIIVPSNYWRDYIIKKFHISPNKITTTHEAVDPTFLKKITKNSKLIEPSNYIIYTGNLYPHKNIKVILDALKKYPQLKLKIICARSLFTKRVEKLIKKYQISNQVEFLGYVPDKKFRSIYYHALTLVHPSLMEGFSLTGLEAMSLNCPVISSNSSCLPEIYQNSVLYFDPNNPDQLAKQITKLQKNPKLRQKLISLGHIQVTKYSWNQTAKKTLHLYQSLI